MRYDINGLNVVYHSVAMTGTLPSPCSGPHADEAPLYEYVQGSTGASFGVGPLAGPGVRLRPAETERRILPGEPIGLELVRGLDGPGGPQGDAWTLLVDGARCTRQPKPHLEGGRRMRPVCTVPAPFVSSPGQPGGPADVRPIAPVSYTHLRAPRDATLSRMPSSA